VITLKPCFYATAAAVAAGIVAIIVVLLFIGVLKSFIIIFLKYNAYSHSSIAYYAKVSFMFFMPKVSIT
jgi:hypothetical protein